MTRLGTGFNSIKTISKEVQVQRNEYEYEYDYDVKTSNRVKIPVEHLQTEFEDSDTHHSRKWSFVFLIVGAPFLVLGFPVHLLISFKKSKSTAPVKSPNRKSEWFHGILFPDNIFTLLCTLVLITISCVLIVYFLTSVWNIFDYLVLRGELAWKLLVNLAIFFRTLPAIVPLFVFWIIGYSFKDVIASFDSFREHFVKRLKLRPRGKATFAHPASPIGFWVKLGLLYFAILCIHVIPIFADGWRGQHWTSVWIGLMYRFIPPLYCTCCWVLASEFQILSGFLTSLLKDDCQITIEIMEEIKDLYKRVTNHVTYVNKKLGKYLSFWIIPVLAFSTISHLILMVFYLAGGISVTTILFFYGIVGEIDDEGMMKSESEQLVRSAVAHIFVGFLEVGLMGFMVLQAIAVSDESRFAHVLINEVIGDHSLPVIKNEELYQATRHLKFYMYMTHEDDNPALMMIPSIARLPLIGYRIHSSKLRNPPLHRRFLNEIV